MSCRTCYSDVYSHDILPRRIPTVISWGYVVEIRRGDVFQFICASTTYPHDVSSRHRCSCSSRCILTMYLHDIGAVVPHDVPSRHSSPRHMAPGHTPTTPPPYRGSLGGYVVEPWGYVLQVSTNRYMSWRTGCRGSMSWRYVVGGWGTSWEYVVGNIISSCSPRHP